MRPGRRRSRHIRGRHAPVSLARPIPLRGQQFAADTDRRCASQALVRQLQPFLPRASGRGRPRACLREGRGSFAGPIRRGLRHLFAKKDRRRDVAGSQRDHMATIRRAAPGVAWVRCRGDFVFAPAHSWAMASSSIQWCPTPLRRRPRFVCKAAWLFSAAQNGGRYLRLHSPQGPRHSISSDCRGRSR